MKIRLKKRGTFGVKRIGLDGKIGKIEKKEGLDIFIKGLEGLAVVSFSPKEAEMIREKLMPKTRAVKKKSMVKRKVRKK